MFSICTFVIPRPRPFTIPTKFNNFFGSSGTRCASYVQFILVLALTIRTTEWTFGGVRVFLVYHIERYFIFEENPLVLRHIGLFYNLLHAPFGSAIFTADALYILAH